MKTSLALLSILCPLALAAPAMAHPNHPSSTQGYLVFWNGIPPKSGTSLGAIAAAPGFWRMAFVSKYPILGAQLPTLLP
ncbi:MAG: hypothetical protein JWO30_26 [Fibrobacteres bacterium]|nr:hypothetical protein [Fibrobacterota bacterium]